MMPLTELTSSADKLVAPTGMAGGSRQALGLTMVLILFSSLCSKWTRGIGPPQSQLGTRKLLWRLQLPSKDFKEVPVVA